MENENIIPDYLIPIFLGDTIEERRERWLLYKEQGVTLINITENDK